MKMVAQAGAVFLVAVTIGVAVWMAGSGVLVLQVLGPAPVLVAVGYLWLLLRREPHMPWQEARAHLRAGEAVVLWRPGCPLSENLLWRLRRTSKVVWVNMWRDREAYHMVLALNHGEEITPVVLVRGQVLITPRAAEVEAAITGG